MHRQGDIFGWVRRWVVAVGWVVGAAACQGGSSELPEAMEGPQPPRGARQEISSPSQDGPDPVSPAGPIDPSPADQQGVVISDQGGEPGARAVELSVNGERVRVVRPSATNPFVVAAAEYDPEDPPVDGATPTAEGPAISLLRQGVIDVIRRVPQLVELSVGDPNGVGDITGYIVEFEGYDGHFYVPTEIDSEVYGASLRERGRFTVGFFLDEVFPPGARRDADWAAQYNRPFSVTMRIWAVDRAHHISSAVVQPLNILPVGRGDLEVTLSMSLPTDLDLYVVEPNGNVIFYDNMRSWTNGQLDLDANAACQSNTNVRYEHIFWPEGQVPEGTYQVRVDNWANCVGGQEVPFEVIVQNCGDISVHESVATGSGGRRDCRNPGTPSCQHIATVEVARCGR